MMARRGLDEREEKIPVGGKIFPASLALLNPYNRKGFLHRRSPSRPQKSDLGSDSAGARPTPLKTSDEISIRAGLVNIATHAGGSPVVNSLRGSPTSSQSGSPQKRPWYPVGRRPFSGESGNGGRGCDESTFVVHPAFRCKSEEKVSGHSADGWSGAAQQCYGLTVGGDFSARSKRDSPPSGGDDGASLSPRAGSPRLGEQSNVDPTARINNQISRRTAQKGGSSASKGKGVQRNFSQEEVVTGRGRIRDQQAKYRLRSQDIRTELLAGDTMSARSALKSSVIFTGHSKQVLALAQQNSVLFSGAADGTAKAWETISQRCIATYKGHRNAVWGMQVANRTLITGSADGTVRFWDIKTAQSLHVIDLRSAVRDVVVVAGFLAVATASPNIEVIDLNRLEPRGSLLGHLLAVSALTPLEAENRLVSGSHDTFIRVWNLDSGKCEAVLRGHGGTIGALCTISRSLTPGSDDNKPSQEILIVSGSGDATVRVWGQAGGRTVARAWTCRAVLEGHRHGVWAAHGLPSSGDGVFATGGGDATIKIWAPKTAVSDVTDRNRIDGSGETIHKEQEPQIQRWVCVGGVRGVAGAVGTILMNELALFYGTSGALIARFPLEFCMPVR